VLYQLSYAHHIALLRYLCQSCLMAHPAGLEPATIRLEGGCSIQLSYGRLFVSIAMQRLNKQLWSIISSEPTFNSTLLDRPNQC
jgi:hypothetical protein